MEKLGLIGLGTIGSYFCEQFINAGYEITVLDMDENRMKAASEVGAKLAKTAADVAMNSDIIFLSLPGSEPVEQVMEGKNGMLSVLKSGQTVVDTGTTRPKTDIRYQALCSEWGVGFLDAPITWRKEGLIIMVGGQLEDYEAVKHLLDPISYKHQYIGASGQGQILKLMNQMVLANQWAAWSEAIEFGRSSNLDPRLLQECLEFSIPDDLYEDDFTSKGQLTLHYKDLGYLLEVAHDNEAYIPLSSAVHEIFKAVKVQENPNWRQVGIITHWRKMNRKDI
jgi:3-hydroxyisobutyrate dehydrogenase-like beta-hydroxyacid dehydrogenase